ncbi:MAG: hypothetical protein J5526_06655 [Bacteroidales bacterium]|nr:hypothetical protein [Bacteroidales bacterium]
MNKSTILLLIAIIGTTLSSFAQNIKASDLVGLLGKSNIEQINQSLSNKKWKYSSSKKESSNEKKITWAYEKNHYDDAALGWITVHFYDGVSIAVSYECFNDKSYSVFKNSIQQSGFVSYKQDVDDDEIETKYKNSNYVLRVRQSRDGYSTRYACAVIKKGSEYDKDNGKRIEKLDDDDYEGDYIEYTLKDGEIDGTVKIYKISSHTLVNLNGGYLFSDGDVVKEFTIHNGEKNGPYKEYYNPLYGSRTLKAEGTYKNGIKVGTNREYYQNGKLSRESYEKNGIKYENEYFENGDIREQRQSKDNAPFLFWKRYGPDVNGNANVLIYESQIDENGTGFTRERWGPGRNCATRICEYVQYVKHNKIYCEESRMQSDGSWKVVGYDSLFYDGNNNSPQKTTKEKIMCMNQNYIGDIFDAGLIVSPGVGANVCYYEKKDGKFDGWFCCFIDTALYQRIHVKKEKISDDGDKGYDSYPHTYDTTKLLKYMTGYIKDNKKQGVWREYHISTGKLHSEFTYINGTPEGPFYYYTDEGKLAVEGTLKNGKLHGELKKHYGHIEETDTWVPEESTTMYDNDEKHGKYTAVNANTGDVVEVYYSHDKRHGKYILSNPESEDVIEGNYSNDKKEGKWTYKDGESFSEITWKDGVQSGMTKMSYKGKPIYCAQYLDDKLNGTAVLYGSNEKKCFEIEFVNGRPNLIIDYRDEHTMSYRYSSHRTFTLTCQHNDTSISIDYIMKKNIFSQIPATSTELAKIIDDCWNSGNVFIPNGTIKCYKSSNSTMVYYYGSVDNDKKVGRWSHFFYDQDVRLNIDYDADGAESYFTVNTNLLYDGKFKYIYKDAPIYEIRQIKEGQCVKKKTKRYNVSNDKKYKGESPVIDYYHIKTESGNVVFENMADINELTKKNKSKTVGSNMGIPVIAGTYKNNGVVMFKMNNEN